MRFVFLPPQAKTRLQTVPFILSTSVTDLLAQLWKGPAQVGEGRIIHNVPVKNVDLVHGHGFLCTHTGAHTQTR